LLRNRGFAARVGLVPHVGARQRPPRLRRASPLGRSASLCGRLVLLDVRLSTRYEFRARSTSFVSGRR